MNIFRKIFAQNTLAYLKYFFAVLQDVDLAFTYCALLIHVFLHSVPKNTINLPLLRLQHGSHTVKNFFRAKLTFFKLAYILINVCSYLRLNNMVQCIRNILFISLQLLIRCIFSSRIFLYASLPVFYERTVVVFFFYITYELRRRRVRKLIHHYYAPPFNSIYLLGV